jgi:CrcB protein
MKILLIIGLGGGLGSIVRFLSQKAVAQFLPVSFPYGTFFINILGSFLIGIFFGISEKSNILSPEVRLFLTTGFCGGFTTFSTFSLDGLMLIRDGQYLYLGLYAGLSVLLGLAATFAGVALMKVI